MSSPYFMLLALGGGWWLASAQAQQAEPGPDLDFLEYLGAWAEEDDEWLVIEEWQKDGREERDDEDAEQSDAERNDEYDEGE